MNSKLKSLITPKWLVYLISPFFKFSTSKETIDTNYNYMRHVCIVNKQIDFSLQLFIQFVRYF